MIVIDLSYKQVLDVDPKAIHKNYFTGNLDLDGNPTIFCISQKSETNHFRFLKRNREYCNFILL